MKPKHPYKPKTANMNGAEVMAGTVYEEGGQMKMDGFDDCIIGLADRYGMPTVIAYDKNKVLGKLMSDGMSREEAEEFFEYNQIGAWVGDYTPVFITPTNKETPCPKT